MKIQAAKSWAGSLSTKIVVCFIGGGVLLSLLLGVLDYRNESRWVHRRASDHLSRLSLRTSRQLGPLLAADQLQAAKVVLQQCVADPQVRGARVIRGSNALLSAGDWQTGPEQSTAPIVLQESREQNLALATRNHTVLATLVAGAPGQPLFELSVDHDYLRRTSRRTALQHLAIQWLVLSCMTLIGLIVLRRWLNGPLQQVAELTRADASSAQFNHAAAQIGGEMGDLAAAIGGMLGRIDRMNRELAERERAFQDLFQFAPVALVSIGPDGRITDANDSAADLFESNNETDLIGCEILQLIRPRDRALFRQTIDRLDINRVLRCEMQLRIGERATDVAVQLASVHNDLGELATVRLSLVDITRSKELIAQISEQRRLLDLVFNHMSDAILLVDREHRVLTANRQFGRLLNLDPRTLIDKPHDPVALWTAIDPIEPEAFAQQLQRLIGDPAHGGQIQFETHRGSFSFNMVPVEDETAQSVGQLWVVQEVTALVRNRRLMEQQSQQLRAVQELGRHLHITGGLEPLLDNLTVALRNVMDVEMVGLTLRVSEPRVRCAQRIHGGEGPLAWPCAAEAAHAVRCELMPRVLADRGTRFWSDLPGQETWTTPFADLGLEALAATALHSRDTNQGLIWIARRGGQRIERHHLYLLEALAPMLSSALYNAQFRDHLVELGLTDPTTALPNAQQFELMLAQMDQDDRRHGAVLMIGLNDYQTLARDQNAEQADRLVHRSADALRECCRSTDLPCRYTDDTLAVLCRGGGSDQARELSERLLERLAEIAADPTELHCPAVSCSIGLAACPDDARDAAPLIDLARQRLESARGKDRCIVAR